MVDWAGGPLPMHRRPEENKRQRGENSLTLPDGLQAGTSAFCCLQTSSHAGAGIGGPELACSMPPACQAPDCTALLLRPYHRVSQCLLINPVMCICTDMNPPIASLESLD